MSMDVYLEAHATRDDFSLDRGDETIAWRRNSVPLSWLLFFSKSELVGSPHGSDAPHLTANSCGALKRYRDRMHSYGSALADFAGDATFVSLADYVESRGFPWVSVRTWEVWICEVDTYPVEFQRAVAAVDAGPTAPDWGGLLDWCHPPGDNRLTPYALFGGANRIHPHRPWLE